MSFVPCQVLDVLIAVIVGGGILGLAKLFSTALWGFVIFFVTVLMIAIVLCKNHKRTASARHTSQRRFDVVVSGVSGAKQIDDTRGMSSSPLHRSPQAHVRGFRNRR